MSSQSRYLDFQHFDILHPKFDDAFIQFQDVPIGSIIRYSRSWRRKVGPNYVVEKWGRQPLYQSVDYNKFVLIVKDKQAADKLIKEYSIPSK